MSFQENLTVIYIVDACCECGLRFCMTKEWRDERLRKRDRFYCPAGHSQVFTGEKPEVVLQRRVESMMQEIEEKRASIGYLERSRATLKGALTKLKKKLGK